MGSGLLIFLESPFLVKSLSRLDDSNIPVLQFKWSFSRDFRSLDFKFGFDATEILVKLSRTLFFLTVSSLWKLRHVNAYVGRVYDRSFGMHIFFLDPLQLPLLQYKLLLDRILISYSLLVKAGNDFAALFRLQDSVPFFSLHTGHQTAPLFLHWELFWQPAERVASVDTFLPLAALLHKVERLVLTFSAPFVFTWLRHRLEDSVVYLVNCFRKFFFHLMRLYGVERHFFKAHSFLKILQQTLGRHCLFIKRVLFHWFEAQLLKRIPKNWERPVVALDAVILLWTIAGQCSWTQHLTGPSQTLPGRLSFKQFSLCLGMLFNGLAQALTLLALESCFGSDFRACSSFLCHVFVVFGVVTSKLAFKCFNLVLVLRSQIDGHNAAARIRGVLVYHRHHVLAVQRYLRVQLASGFFRILRRDQMRLGRLDARF